MPPSENVLDPTETPAVAPVPRPIDHALRYLSMSANHGRLWMGVAAGLALTGKRGRRAAIRGLVTLGASSFVSNVVVKPVVGRRRPDIERTSFGRRVDKAPWTSSFPSGHAASAAAFATGASMELPAASALLVPLAAAVAYSRVHVGVHHRSDVWAGAAIGVGMAVLGKGMWPVKPWGPALTAAGDAPALLGGAGLTVVVNNRSGSSDGAAGSIGTALPDAKVVEWDTSADLAGLIGDGVIALGVAGGDGTVASVAQVAHHRRLPLAVFPTGTLNHFAKALGLDKDADTVAAVESGTAGMVDLATIDGTAFLNTASIGGYPEMVSRRDRYSHRMGKWPATAYALLRTLRRAGRAVPARGPAALPDPRGARLTDGHRGTHQRVRVAGGRTRQHPVAFRATARRARRRGHRSGRVHRARDRRSPVDRVPRSRPSSAMTGA